MRLLATDVISIFPITLRYVLKIAYSDSSSCFSKVTCITVPNLLMTELKHQGNDSYNGFVCSASISLYFLKEIKS